MKLSIIFPIYNEEKILEHSVRDIVNKLRKQNIDFEIILIENGSEDNTPKIAEQLAENNTFPK